MTMSRGISHWKTRVRWALGVVFLIDALLLFANWRNGGARASAEALKRLRSQHAQLDKDVRRARAIRERLPAVQAQCDRFFREQLQPTSRGYSAVVADLSALAAKAGLRTSGVTFRQHAVENRGVIEVGVAAAVEGDYPSLVRFINGLERSKNFYVMESLALESGTAGTVRLNLELKTYFRS